MFHLLRKTSSQRFIKEHTHTGPVIMFVYEILTKNINVSFFVVKFNELFE